MSDNPHVLQLRVPEYEAYVLPVQSLTFSFLLVIDSRFECCHLTLHACDFLIVGNNLSRNPILLVFTCFFESFIRSFQASKSTFTTDIQSRFSTLHTINLLMIRKYNCRYYISFFIFISRIIFCFSFCIEYFPPTMVCIFY